ALNVSRMRMLGAEVIGVDSGSRTLKDAINEAMRDWVTNVRTTHYLLGSVLGAHPYPTMVRDFHSCIGREARAQILAAEKRLPTHLLACVGGGSNAIGLFHEFLKDESVKLIGIEAGGRGNGLRQTGGASRRRTGVHWSTPRSPAGNLHLLLANRRRPDLYPPLNLRWPRLSRHWPGARLACRSAPRGILCRVRRRRPRRRAHARPHRRHHPRPRIGARDRQPDRTRLTPLQRRPRHTQPLRPGRPGHGHLLPRL